MIEGLDKFFDSKDFTPKLTGELLSKSPYKSTWYHWTYQFQFDTDINIPFNRVNQKLFEIKPDDASPIDLSVTENFVEYFLDDSYNISPKHLCFGEEMILGLTSYYA